jgi:hypothetical protein
MENRKDPENGNFKGRLLKIKHFQGNEEVGVNLGVGGGSLGSQA